MEEYERNNLTGTLAFLSEFHALLVKHGANFQVEEQSCGYNGYEVASVDIEVRGESGKLFDYVEIPGKYSEAEDLEEIIKQYKEKLNGV